MCKNVNNNYTFYGYCSFIIPFFTYFLSKSTAAALVSLLIMISLNFSHLLAKLLPIVFKFVSPLKFIVVKLLQSSAK